MGKNKEQRSSKGSEAIDHARFLQMLTEEFPEGSQALEKYSRGLLHCEMGAFAQLTEKAMDEGRFSRVEKHFNFIDRVRESASPEVENAIEVSYLEYLALSEVTDSRCKAIKRMPKTLRAILLEIDGRGRWA